MRRVGAIYEWYSKAQCRGTPVSYFFPIEHKSDDNRYAYDTALQVCLHCDVRDECLETAIRHNITEGMWGGKTPRQRRMIVTERNKAKGA